MVSPKYIVLQKRIGQTPLAAINEWRLQNPTLSKLPATYAGRLDPMASGTLLVLLGEECKKKDAYLGLDKGYEIQVVIGIGTDTGDTLGLASIVSDSAEIPMQEIQRALKKLIGTHSVPYPSFSSKTVNGIPLFEYALRGMFDTISIPEHEERIYKIKVLELQALSGADLYTRIQDTLTSVPRTDEPSKLYGADFRQDDVRARWNEVLGKNTATSFNVLTLRVTCASGTYMRTLASRLAHELGTKGFALSIHRSKIGRYIPIGFWWKTY